MMDFEETLKAAIARAMKQEVSDQLDTFTQDIVRIAIDGASDLFDDRVDIDRIAEDTFDVDSIASEVVSQDSVRNMIANRIQSSVDDLDIS